MDVLSMETPNAPAESGATSAAVMSAKLQFLKIMFFYLYSGQNIRRLSSEVMPIVWSRFHHLLRAFSERGNRSSRHILRSASRHAKSRNMLN
jgi:hypothetical protein